MKLLTLHTHGCLRASLRDCSSSSSSAVIRLSSKLVFIIIILLLLLLVSSGISLGCQLVSGSKNQRMEMKCWLIRATGTGIYLILLMKITPTILRIMYTPHHREAVLSGFRRHVPMTGKTGLH